MKRYLEYQDEKSYKFWQVEVEGNSQTVKYGKIGTGGTTKVKEFDSPEAAVKDAEKQMNSKLKKGYVEKAAQSEKRVAKKFALDYYEGEDGAELKDKIEKFIRSGNPEELTHLIIGHWEEAYDNSPDKVVEYLIEQKDRFPKLKSIYFGDMDSEECEVSWINQTDLGPLAKAFPQLEELIIKGSMGLRLSGLNHSQLKRLTIICGGLGSKVINDVATAELPALERLELYLGIDNYGFNGTVEDLRPFMEKGRFPKLSYLGLMNSGITDDVAIAVAGAPILEQIDTLDLSMGTLSDKGGEALVTSEAIGKLKFLNLNHHYMSDEMMKRFRALKLNVDIGCAEGPDFMDGDWDDRYPEITE